MTCSRHPQRSPCGFEPETSHVSRPRSPVTHHVHAGDRPSESVCPYGSVSLAMFGFYWRKGDKNQPQSRADPRSEPQSCPLPLQTDGGCCPVQQGLCGAGWERGNMTALRFPHAPKTFPRGIRCANQSPLQGLIAKTLVPPKCTPIWLSLQVQVPFLHAAGSALPSQAEELLGFPTVLGLGLWPALPCPG